MLFPVIIQGWFTPVKPAGIAHGGIPQVLYDGQLQGLLCLIDPWPELQLQSWTMAVDDRVDLYINDDPTPVAGVTIQPGEEALRQRLYIPHGYLRQGVNRLHYKVFRVGGNTSEDSRDLLVLYHLRTPDNLDLVIPPDVINEGVSAERAAQGVEFRFTYNNRRPYDRIRLRIGDTEVTFDVPDGNGPITHTLFTDTFRAAGDNPSAVIQFFVFDQLGNPSKSPEKRLDIHLDRLKLEKPSIKEATNDVLDPLAAKDTLTAVIQAFPDMVGTDVQVTWAGTPGEGSHSTAWIPVTTQGTLEISLPISVLAFNLGQKATVSYKVKRGGTENDSDEFFLAVLPIRDGDNNLPTPAIDGAVGNELNVTTLADTARTRIRKWPFIALGQKLWLRYTGTKADGDIFTHQTYNGDPIPADGLNGMQPRTPVAELAKLMDGSTLELEFKVSLDGSTDESKALRFQDRIYIVKALNLIAPTVKEASGSSLNPIAARDTLTGVIRAYDNMTGTSVKMTWAGTPGSGSHSTAWIPVTAQRDLEVPLPNTLVAHNLGQQATMSYKVKRGGTEQDSDDFDLAVLPIRDGDTNLPTPAIDGTAGNVLNVTALVGTEQLRVAKWALQFSGQGVWLRYDGIKADGTATEKVIWEGFAHHSADGLVTLAAIDWLRELKDGSEVKITFKVNFDGVANASTAVTFPVRTYTVKAVSHPELIVDTFPIRFQGIVISAADSGLGWIPTADPANSIAHRAASGGVPPYTYTSSAPLVVSVDQTGKISAIRAGDATITVSDSASQKKEIIVSSIVRTFTMKTTPDIWFNEYLAWAAGLGGRSADDEIMEAINAHKFITSATSRPSSLGFASPNLESQYLRWYNISDYIVPPNYPNVRCYMDMAGSVIRSRGICFIESSD